MSLTLLLDLDDTLLENDINVFLPQFLKSYAIEAAGVVDPNRFVQLLVSATQEMARNRQPDCTLRDVFNAAFYPALGVDLETFQPIADHFYAEEFPKLQGWTHAIPQAVEMVAGAQQRGYRMAIATNPLFPLTAIQQRLAWAELPVEQHPFEVVSSYETFHFAKPEASYFTEMLARLGWPSGPVVMVGDDMQRDILPARQIGLPVYWARPDGAGGDGGEIPGGGLDGLLEWLERQPAERLMPDFSSPAGILASLRATPAALDSLCRDLPAEAWIEQPQPGEWSLTEIICHLRDVDLEVNLPRVEKLLAEDNPFIPGQNTDPWVNECEYNRQDGRLALQEFTAARLQLLARLEALDAAGWQRPARHAIFGPSLLVELVNITASHDRLHIQQAHQALTQVTAS